MITLLILLTLLTLLTLLPLLTALLQVLLLADNIVVKQLLLDKETNTVGSVCIKVNREGEGAIGTDELDGSRTRKTIFLLFIFLFFFI